jgi:hypothetical protein
MRSWLSLALAATIWCGAPVLGLSPDDDKKPPQDQAKSPADELKAIQQEFTNLQREFSKAYQAAKTPAEKKELQRPQPKPFVERAIKLAEAHSDSPAAVDALFWAMQMSPRSAEAEQAEKLLAEGFIAKATLTELAAKLARNRTFYASAAAAAAKDRAAKSLDDPSAPKLLAWAYSSSMYGPSPQIGEEAARLLIEKFVDDDALATVCQNVGSRGGAKWVKPLRDVLEKSKNRKVLAAAHFGLGTHLKSKEGADAQSEAEKHFDTIVKDFATDAKPLAEQAKGELREIRLLGLGKTIPEIEGEDLQGKSFKISDYRGKVVLLDFWGFW